MTGASLAALLRNYVQASLTADTALGAMVHIIGDDARALPVPGIVMADGVATAWGSKDRPGVEWRIDLIIIDRGPAEGMDAIAAAVARSVAGFARNGPGWESGEWLLLRQRGQRLRGGERRETMTLRVRAWPSIDQIDQD